jgi:DNA-binding NarL/FixJ family response regulator
MSADAGGSMSADAGESMSTDAGKIKVFLVDDVSELRTLVRIALEEDPSMEVVGEAANGREGVEKVGQAQPDVVLLDLSMPDMDGLEAIPLMRERAPNARLVVLSGHEAGRVSLEALDQGATRYLNKAADFEAIRTTVHEVAQIEPPFTDERFSIVHRMWDAFLAGAIDDILAEADPEVVWHPYIGQGRELRSEQEARSFYDEVMAGGRIGDARAYGVEPTGSGLIVMGTLEIWGPDGLTEAPVYWAFCFHGAKVALAAGFDRHEQAEQIIQERCPA